jgi:hypothetical protein
LTAYACKAVQPVFTSQRWAAVLFFVPKRHFLRNIKLTRPAISLNL